ncbi:hypothetical protein FSARC_12919 [Fusarium sarcochroum]|uniref:Uncharacterized protein n=1 Tax=Fusarium sarcochroum TaxID=1208366 RepID=A0A8H4WVJ8_9HYPO|nr:hypothetical protein FSARC_12919 [Fusarium sarcochroum]
MPNIPPSSPPTHRQSPHTTGKMETNNISSNHSDSRETDNETSMSAEQEAADKEKRDRARYARRRRKCNELNLVDMALSGQRLNEEQCAALLKQPTYPPDATVFLQSLNGYIEEMGDMKSFKRELISSVGSRLPFLLRSSELCKFALADWRVPTAKDISQMGLHGAFDMIWTARLRRQSGRKRKEKARAVARRGPGQRGLTQVQYWARKMLDEFEAAEERGDPLTNGTANAAWSNIVTKNPVWIEKIYIWGQDYGFVCYTSSETEQRPANSKEAWFSIFNDKRLSEDLYGYRVGAWDSIMGGLTLSLSKTMTPLWQSSCQMHGLPTEDCPSAFRQHFKKVAVPSLESPRMSRNTFLVLHDACIWPELDTVTEGMSIPHPPEPDSSRDEYHPMVFLWAYDADWEPPRRANQQQEATTVIEGCTCQGTFAGGYGGADEDGYEGRVKVDVPVLFTWLYWARHVSEPHIDLKDIWRMAQTMPGQIWTCCHDRFDSSRPDSRMPGQPPDPIKEVLDL